MIAFVIHNASCSGDTVMFAESVAEWWVDYAAKHEAIRFEKTGNVGDEEFGRVYFERSREPDYVTAYEVSPGLVLRFGG